jgi:hypothetical protein
VESEDGTRLSKHGAIMHCGYCKASGHNRGGCSELKAAIIRENDVVQDNGGAHYSEVARRKLLCCRT